MDTALQNYNALQGGKSSAIDTLNNGINSIGNLEGSFNDIKDQISGAIIEYSDKIDEYGKLAFKIIFSVFMVLDIAIAAFITLLLFCSFKCCKSCCCFRCLFKSLLHILWNILAFLTFLVLLLGSIFTTIGIVGKDLISVVSYLVSDKNLSKPKPILVEQAKDYLTICINGNGDIRHELQIDTGSMNNINALRSAANEINELKTNMESLSHNTPSYDEYLEKAKDRTEYRIDNFELISLGDDPNLNFRTSLNQLNSHIPNGNNHKWSISCSNLHSCTNVDNSNSAPLCINPNTCTAVNQIKSWYTSNDNVEVVNAFINSILLAKRDNTELDTDNPANPCEATQRIRTILDDLKLK